MLITYKENTSFENARKTLIEHGYTFREELLPDRTYFVLEDTEGTRYFSISAHQENDKRAQGILVFRDNLRNNPQLVEEYARLKKWLSQDGCDRNEYTRKKSDFISQYSQRVHNLLYVTE